MESHRSSRLHTGPLSAPAQRILAALWAQHAGRADRSRHIEAYSGGLRGSQQHYSGGLRGSQQHYSGGLRGSQQHYSGGLRGSQQHYSGGLRGSQQHYSGGLRGSQQHYSGGLQGSQQHYSGGLRGSQQHYSGGLQGSQQHYSGGLRGSQQHYSGGLRGSQQQQASWSRAQEQQTDTGRAWHRPYPPHTGIQGDSPERPDTPALGETSLFPQTPSEGPRWRDRAGEMEAQPVFSGSVSAERESPFSALSPQTELGSPGPPCPSHRQRAAGARRPESQRAEPEPQGEDPFSGGASGDPGTSLVWAETTAVPESQTSSQGGWPPGASPTEELPARAESGLAATPRRKWSFGRLLMPLHAGHVTAPEEEAGCDARWAGAEGGRGRGAGGEQARRAGGAERPEVATESTPPAEEVGLQADAGSSERGPFEVNFQLLGDFTEEHCQGVKETSVEGDECQGETEEQHGHDDGIVSAREQPRNEDPWSTPSREDQRSSPRNESARTQSRATGPDLQEALSVPETPSEGPEERRGGSEMKGKNRAMAGGTRGHVGSREASAAGPSKSIQRRVQKSIKINTRALGFRDPPPPVRGTPYNLQGHMQDGEGSFRRLGFTDRSLTDSSPFAESVALDTGVTPSLAPSPAQRREPWRLAVPPKRKHRAPPPKDAPLARRPGKWEPPRASQGTPRNEVRQEAGDRGETDTPKHPTPSASTKAQNLHRAAGGKGASQEQHPEKAAPPGQGSHRRDPPAPQSESGQGSGASGAPKPSKRRRGERARTAAGEEGADEAPKPSLALTSDPRVCEAGRLSAEERGRVLEEAGRARALVLTLLFQDGSTQLDPEQKCGPPVSGVLVLLKRELDSAAPGDERLVYLRLERRPAWAQQEPQHSLDLFTRELLLLVVSGAQPVVCYKAKELLRTALLHYTPHLSWKHVSRCQVLDPQILAWLLDPADSAACFQDLVAKHCPRAPGPPAPALGPRKVTQVISSLSLLYRLMVELRSSLQTKGLWKLYCNMELRMIPVLAAMESHRIHVDKEALKRTSEMLGVKLKQLEQEAHKAAGQQFLVSSSAQLRLVLFEKLRLQEKCENKKLPKTFLKQQQSTSEAALLQLQDLHPLPSIILEYRQVHKIKSTFVDGILSCVNKTFISSTWNQTSAVSGRLSAKHPNFQALPKQPVQITKKQYIQGKEAEMVTVHPRTMFIPQHGCTFLSADFCQVELRLLAHLSSDPELLRIFQNPEADVFTMLASQWKGVSEESVSTEDREHAKRIVYSVVYGAGRERLSGILGVSAEQASRFQDSFLQTYRQVQTFIQRTIQQCQKLGYVVSIMGRRRSLPHIRSADWGVRMQAERQAVNFVVQGSAADLCKMAMIRIFSQVSSSTSLTAKLVAQIHDELLFEVEDSQLEDFAVLVKNSMESLQHVDCLGVHLTVPLKVAVSSGRSWGSMSELSLPHTPLSPSF